MSEKCKYCDYVSKCSRFCEYNSIMCLMRRSFPKIVDKTYEKLEKENQELQELKEQLEVGEQQYNDLVEEKENLQEQLSNSHQMENQQKEFIEYLESEMILFQEYMKEIECSDRCHGDYPITYYTSKCRLNEVTEILSKYKEIIGGKDE